jgi:hypothetical protein
MSSLDDLDDDEPTTDHKRKPPSLDELDDDDDAGAGDEGEGEGEEEAGEGEGEEEEEEEESGAAEDDGSKVYAICPPPSDWKSGQCVVVRSVAQRMTCPSPLIIQM